MVIVFGIGRVLVVVVVAELRFGIELEVGPILLDNVTCDQSHLELLQCVHSLDIGFITVYCDRLELAICLNVSDSATTTTSTLDLPIPNTITTETTPQILQPNTMHEYSY